MNTITYKIHNEDDEGGLITFTAVVEDAKACGPYEVHRTHSFEGDCDVSTMLIEFLNETRRRNQHLHIKEHEGE